MRLTRTDLYGTDRQRQYSVQDAVSTAIDVNSYDHDKPNRASAFQTRQMLARLIGVLAEKELLNAQEVEAIIGYPFVVETE